MTVMFPPHGPVDCRRCFEQPGYEWEFSNSNDSRWRLENSPAAFGARSPVVLVLGFSKGENQCKAGLSFDEVAFRGMRTQLSKILSSLRLLPRSIDDCIRANEEQLAFGSLIRCSISQWDTKTGKFSKSGNSILQEFSKGDVTSRVAENCVNGYLRELPERTKLVVMLGNELRYINFCKERIGKVRGSVCTVNPVSYDSGGVRFVHVIHAKAQGALIPDWIEGRKSQKEKRAQAVGAVNEVLAAHPRLMRVD